MSRHRASYHEPERVAPLPGTLPVKIVLATRKSRLALWQAHAAKRTLEAAQPELEVELLPLSSSGDENTTTALERFGRIGIFTVEVDRAVLEGRAHAAVHSLKDMTTELQDGLLLAGTLGRGPVEDAFVSPGHASFEELPEGARIATGSRRRAAFARAARPDLEITGIRGNVETRLQKLSAGHAEGMFLARAGLVRLGLEEHLTQVLDVQRFLPAVGQGIVGLTCRADDADTHRLLLGISDLEALHEGLAERSLLRELRGGCNVPVGAHATVREGALHLVARVPSLDGQTAVEGELTGSRDHAASLGKVLARHLLDQGAGALIEAARQAES